MYFNIADYNNMIDRQYTFKSDNSIYAFGNIRQIFSKTIYNDMNCISKLSAAIQKFIDCISIEYNNDEKKFIIKIKKTNMKKNKYKFENTSIYYYSLMNQIFNDFLNSCNSEIYNALQFNDNGLFEKPLYQYLIDNFDKSIMLCNIVCIGTNYIHISL